MIPLYGSLIFCHLLADFVLPVKKLSQKGLTALAYSAIHVSLVILILLLSGDYDNYGIFKPVFLGVIFIEYLIIGLIRNTLAKKSKDHIVFIIEQAYHFMILLTIAYFWDNNSYFYWDNDFFYSIIACATGIMGITLFSGKLMKLVTDDFINQNVSLKEDIESGLIEGGKYIGILERILIFIFILIDQPLAVGFLIAAKSLLRIESDPKHHRRMEYILVGTLFSFLLALLFSLFTKELLSGF